MKSYYSRIQDKRKSDIFPQGIVNHLVYGKVGLRSWVWVEGIEIDF